MPSVKAFVPHHRKRQLSEAEPETESLLHPPAKQRKLEEHQKLRTLSSYWDNLSKLWLTDDALQEFNRRTIRPTIPIPPHRTGKEDIDPAKLKRFARHGGPSLSDIRGVSLIQSFSDSPPDKPSIRIQKHLFLLQQ